MYDPARGHRHNSQNVSDDEMRHSLPKCLVLNSHSFAFFSFRQRLFAFSIATMSPSITKIFFHSSLKNAPFPQILSTIERQARSQLWGQVGTGPPRRFVEGHNSLTSCAPPRNGGPRAPESTC